MTSEAVSLSNSGILQDVNVVKDETHKINIASSNENETNATSKSSNSSSGTGLSKNGGLTGIFTTCLKPFCSLFLWKREKHKKDPWVIAFNELTEIRLIGSGAQGAVFLGHYKNQEVAIKKVRNEKDTEIKHLRHLDHRNIVKFRGICKESLTFCLVMEYCPYGQLFEVLREGRAITPALLVDWSTQIADGMHYLHMHKIVHRDLKSPNILISYNDIIKISDFGTCKELSEKSAKMTFTGTVAWMAPEMIRNEPCSEKVDVWSYGIVIWELLTCEMPYKGVDCSAIIWGVGNNSLKLPIPTGCPESYKLLLNLCWNGKPKNRPSFRQILMHIEIAATEVLHLPLDNYLHKQVNWKKEVDTYFDHLKSQGTQNFRVEEDLIQKRKDQLKHAKEVRVLYEERLERTNILYKELAECIHQLQIREEELNKREKQLYPKCRNCRGMNNRYNQNKRSACSKSSAKTGSKHSNGQRHKNRHDSLRKETANHSFNVPEAKPKELEMLLTRTRSQSLNEERKVIRTPDFVSLIDKNIPFLNHPSEKRKRDSQSMENAENMEQENKKQHQDSDKNPAEKENDISDVKSNEVGELEWDNVLSLSE
eukprot:gene17368-19106_t